MDDRRIADALEQREPVPYPGTWLPAPFPERSGHAVIAQDPGLSALAVDRATGHVRLLAEDGGAPPELVNSTVRALVDCSRAYAEAAAREIDADDEDAGDALTDALLERFRAIDPAAVDRENAFWSVAAEELGYGITG
nr:SUKH-4 family immunity protein [Streptomyces hainanensis]